MLGRFKNIIREEEPGLHSIHTQPKIGIGQRAFLVRTPEGNLLWDCVPLIDDATVAAIKALLAKLPSDFRYEPGLVVAEGDYVTIHGRYFGWGPKPMVAVDIFRVANGKIAEHWDVMQEEVPVEKTVNGNPMFTPESVE